MRTLQSPKLRRATAVAVVCMLGLATGLIAADYLGSGKHPTRFLRWQYYGVTSANGSYINPASSAMSTWSSTTDLSLSRSSNFDVGFVTNNYGSVSWAGLAVCYDNGGQNWLSNPAVFNRTLAYCYAYNNRYYMDGDGFSRRKNLFMHEAGHCFSLAHRNVGSSIMYPYVQSVTSPNSRDRQLINARY